MSTTEAKGKGLSPTKRAASSGPSHFDQIDEIVRSHAKTVKDLSDRYSLDSKRLEPLGAIIEALHSATTLSRIEAERVGVAGSTVKELAKWMGMSNARMFDLIGVPKATAEKRAATDTAITGAPGYSALGMVRLLGMAMEMAANSDAPEAKDFDVAKWLGSWIERPQPALGGRKPAELLDTPTGLDTVVRLLGAIESGAYL